jgi:hypothetical protein
MDRGSHWTSIATGGLFAYISDRRGRMSNDGVLDGSSEFPQLPSSSEAHHAMNIQVPGAKEKVVY